LADNGAEQLDKRWQLPLLTTQKINLTNPALLLKNFCTSAHPPFWTDGFPFYTGKDHRHI